MPSGTASITVPGLESRWDLVHGLRVHARWSAIAERQDQPAVVLVHGLVVSSRYMVPTAVRLAASFDVYAPDLPGFGLSSKPDRALSVAGLANSLSAWMDALKLDRAVLLGNSFGCQVLAEFAVRYPERISSMVLVGPTMDPSARSLPQQFGRWVVDNLREPPSYALIQLRDYFDAGAGRALATLRFALEDQIEQKLPSIQAPTLVVRGTRDAFVPHSWAEEAARLLPAGRLVEIPRAAHAVNYNAPEDLVRVVAPFALDATGPLERAGGDGGE